MNYCHRQFWCPNRNLRVPRRQQTLRAGNQDTLHHSGMDSGSHREDGLHRLTKPHFVGQQSPFATRQKLNALKLKVERSLVVGISSEKRIESFDSDIPVLLGKQQVEE